MTSKTTKIKKISAFVLSILLWVMLGLSAILLIFATVLKTKGALPFVFGIGFFQIVSGSMEPELNVGDIIVGKKVQQDEYQIGDNVIFYYKEKVVTHRLIGFTEDGSFITHGINNAEGSNEIIAYKDVLARQAAHFKHLGTVLQFIRSPFGFILIIFVPLTGLIVYQTIDLSKKMKEYKEEKTNQTVELTEEMSEDINKIKQEIESLKGAAEKKEDLR